MQWVYSLCVFSFLPNTIWNKSGCFGPAEFWEFLCCCLRASAVLNSLLAELHKRDHAAQIFQL